MRRMHAVILCLIISFSPAFAQSWVREELRFGTVGKIYDKVAPLYMPQAAIPVSAIIMVISGSSEISWVENYYVYELVRNGTAVLIVNEVRTSDLRNVIDSIDLRQAELEAFSAIAELQKDKRIDPARISVMVISNRSLDTSLLARRGMRQINTLSFAVNNMGSPICGDEFSLLSSVGSKLGYLGLSVDGPKTFKFCLQEHSRFFRN